MPDRIDRNYYEARVRQERAIASTCEDNAVALAHFRMADEYERRLGEALAESNAATPSAAAHS